MTVENLKESDALEFNADRCDFCDDDSKASIACGVCLVKLCEFHQKSHLKTKSTKDHELIPLVQLDSDTFIALDETQ